MKILITLDYELFLNDIVGTIDNCLIKPMECFNNVCANHGVKAVIFVDMAYVFRLKQLSENNLFAKSEYEKVVSNIIALQRFGHDIELHLHPQWFFSDLIGEAWVLDWDHYKLSDIPVNEASDYFEKSVCLLEEIIGSKVIAFRAGGYSIQDFVEFHNVMKNNKLVVDSSVLPFAKTSNKGKNHRYDYSKPSIKTLYRFSADVAEEDRSGILYELPISTCKSMGIWKYFQTKRMNMRRYRTKNWEDGGDFPQAKMRVLYQYLCKISAKMLTVASIDYQSFFNLEYVYRSYKEKGAEYFTIIGHPKNISADSLAYLDSFLSKVENEDDIIVIRDVVSDCFICEK